jgi:hypothetical protein
MTGLKMGVADHYSESNEAARRGNPFLIGEIPSCSSDYPIVIFGPKMFGRIASLVMSYAAVVGVFAEIPIVSNWAFWFLLGAYLLWIGVNELGSRRLKVMLMLSILLTMVAVVGVFIEIPIVSNFAFWVMAASYVLMVASTDIERS